MSIQKLFSQFDDYMKKIDQRTRNEDYKRIDATEKNLTDIRTLLSDSKRIKDDIESQYSLLSSDKQREISFKIKTLKSDYDLRNTAINRIEEKLNHNKNLNDLMTNGSKTNLTAGEINKTNREGILDLHKHTDYQQELLHGIKSDMVDTRTNLKGMVVEVKQQGETLNRVQNNLQETNTVVKRTDKNITQMQRREFCHKLLLHILAVLLFISIIVACIFKLTRKNS